MIEDKLPDNYKRVAYHPTPFVYAWKRKDLEKLFDELMKWNIAIAGGEVWIVEKSKTESVIPLKGGSSNVFYWKTSKEEGEQWYDFVERSIKEAVDFINSSDLENNARIDRVHRIWYHFDFSEE